MCVCVFCMYTQFCNNNNNMFNHFYNKYSVYVERVLLLGHILPGSHNVALPLGFKFFSFTQPEGEQPIIPSRTQSPFVSNALWRS